QRDAAGSVPARRAGPSGRGLAGLRGVAAGGPDGGGPESAGLSRRAGAVRPGRHAEERLPDQGHVMRTTDFTKAPPQAQATAMFVGATRYRGPLSIVVLSFTWYRMLADLKRMRGYCWHKVYWEFPFTLGTLAFFTDRDAMLRFARSRYHRKLMI